MTKAEIESLIEKCRPAIPPKECIGEEFRHWLSLSALDRHIFIKTVNDPAMIQTLAENYLAALKLLKKIHHGPGNWMEGWKMTWAHEVTGKFLDKVGIDASEGKERE